MNDGLRRLARVLLVDDDAHLLAGLRERLRAHYSIVTATGGVEALAALRGGERCDVVVADMRMPGMNGLDLLRWVRAEFPGTARVMLTGDESSATARLAINDGAVSGLVQKPCSAVELVAAIDTALARAATERIAQDSVEVAIGQRERTNAVLTAGLQLGAPMADVLTAVAALRHGAAALAQDAEFGELDRLVRRLGAMFDRFLEQVQRLGDGETAVLAAAGADVPPAAAS
jgi:DNA-binding NtrC family response regulator